MARWLDLLKKFIAGIWFRATLFTLIGVGFTLASLWFSRLFPDTYTTELGQNAVGTILQILASSMLAVTTFSLTAVMSAYTTAESSGTPRSTQLLSQDTTSHNALSTFVGVFAYSIIGIVALSTGLYNDAGRTILFFGTIIIILIVIATMLAWISFITNFGSLPDTIDRVERAAKQAMSSYADDPWLGGLPWQDPGARVKEVCSDMPGFVIDVDMAALNKIAEKIEGKFWLVSRPGMRTGSRIPLVYLDSQLENLDQIVDQVQNAFIIDRHRSFTHDPRLGLIALSEISSNALSSGSNDPGTAIEVLGAIERVLSSVVGSNPKPGKCYPRVLVQPIKPYDLLIDAFRPTVRDGAGSIEVANCIQKEIGRLLAFARPDWAHRLRKMAKYAFDQTASKLSHPDDLAELSANYKAAIAVCHQPADDETQQEEPE